MSPVRDTSLLAWTQVLRSLPKRQAQVYFAFKQTPYNNLTDSELAKDLGWSINCVTPRRGELEKKGMIVDDGRRVCTVTGNLRHCWKLRRENKK